MYKLTVYRNEDGKSVASYYCATGKECVTVAMLFWDTNDYTFGYVQDRDAYGVPIDAE